jgi:hypothetical protein
MFKMRTALLGVLALFIASGIAASVASASGPYWHVNGKKLGQGESRQVKLQMKGTGIITILEEPTQILIECKTSLSEGMTITGQGKSQGQGKGRLIFTQCKVVKPVEDCGVAQPVQTAQLKFYLAINPNNKQQKYVALFGPQNPFLIIEFTGLNCPLGNVTVQGSVAAELAPTEVNSQEMLLSFPDKPITEVLLEQELVKPSLDGGAVALHAFYGSRLATGETWGVFAQ